MYWEFVWAVLGQKLTWNPEEDHDQGDDVEAGVKTEGALRMVSLVLVTGIWEINIQ